MKQRMKDFRQWVKEHKGLLAVAGISVTVLVALVLCARNKDEIDHILSLGQVKVLMHMQLLKEELLIL